MMISLIDLQPIARHLFRWLLPVLYGTDAGPLPPQIAIVESRF